VLKQDENLDFSENPRKAFIGFLIYQLQPVVIGLYGNSQGMKRRSISALVGIIDSLDNHSQTSLEPERKALEDELKTTVEQFNDDTLHGIYARVTAYLHKTYLAEINWFKPMNPKPKPIRNEEEQ
jgi:hypothetical protein